MRRIPPFAAVRAFEATARLMSFTRAAEELCISQSAVSHQVRQLEDGLGARLFDRMPRGLELTPRGRTYLKFLTQILDMLEAATEEVRGEAAEELTIKGTPGVINLWLLPRLRRLAEETGLQVRLMTALPPTDFTRGDCDVTIHWGAKPVFGAVVEPFMATPKIAVASPRLAADFASDPAGAFRRAVKLRDLTDDAWEEWAKGAEVDVGQLDGPMFPDCAMVQTAVLADQGIALAYEALVAGELAAGRIVRIHPHATGEKLIYSLAYPESLRNSARVRIFRNWLFSEVGLTSEAPLMAAE